MSLQLILTDEDVLLYEKSMASPPGSSSKSEESLSESNSRFKPVDDRTLKTPVDCQPNAGRRVYEEFF